MSDDAQEVLNTLVFKQKEIPSKDGRWFVVRIMPYRTFDDRIDGIVITFINISDHKVIEEKLIISETKNRILLSDSSEIKIILSNDRLILDLNPEAELFLGKGREECIHKDFVRMFIPEKSQRGTEKILKMMLEKGLNEKLKMRVTDVNGNINIVDCFVTLSLNKLNKTEGMIISIKKKQDYE